MPWKCGLQKSMGKEKSLRYKRGKNALQAKKDMDKEISLSVPRIKFYGRFERRFCGR